jgi:Tol biopolymer transport system component/DNA-binding winged helix-turn-helix (wHTH) protein
MAGKETYEFESFRFEAEDGSLTRDGERVPLPPKAADLLLTLVQRPGQVVTREELKAILWDVPYVGDQNLSYHVHKLRKAFGPGFDGQQIVETVSPKGFRLICPVRRASAVPSVPGGSHALNGTLPSSSEQARRHDGTQRAEPPRLPSLGVSTHYSLRERFAWPAFWLGGAAFLAAIVLAAGVLLTYLWMQPVGLHVVEYQPLTDDGQRKDGLALHAEGDRVYYSQNSGGLVSFSIPIGGGEPTSLFERASQFVLFDVSAKRGEYLAGRHGEKPLDLELWAVPFLSGMPRRVGHVSCRDAAWSKDAEHIACVNGETLLIASATGADVRNLPIPPGSARQISSVVWSPDGQLLRFSIQTEIEDSREPSGHLWEVGTDGRGLRPLLEGWNNPPHEDGGVWTPDGAFFIFQSWRAGRTDLWALPTRHSLFGHSSSAPIRLTGGPRSFGSPTISADGQTIIAAGMEMRGELVRFDPSTGGLAPYLGGIPGTWLTFSPDGRDVAYISYPQNKLIRADRNGGERRDLTSGMFDADGTAWSPDGKWISFRSRMGGAHMKIYLIPCEGGVAMPITPVDVEQGIATWSSRGDQLAYGDVPQPLAGPRGDEVIHVYNILTRTVSTLPGSQGLWTARWSPDGKYLAALTIRGNVLTTFEFATGKWRQFPAANNVSSPTWSRDSQYIFYDTEGPQRLFERLRISDGHVDQIIDLNSLPILSYWWSGLAPDNSPIFLRNLGTTELYALRLERQ